jgi:mycofactocin precursor
MSDQEKEVGVQEEEIFTVEEIKIEELAIDGICGVY